MDWSFVSGFATASYLAMWIWTSHYLWQSQPAEEIGARFISSFFMGSFWWFYWGMGVLVYAMENTPRWWRTSRAFVSHILAFKSPASP